ncbi:hypothetical protein ACFPTY_13835 [Halomonas beimenensis]|uniref:hypothetical protein n=1 Tax=Halomonas beimenensis TaxID=475662 RepID=UPI00361A8EC7
MSSAIDLSNQSAVLAAWIVARATRAQRPGSDGGSRARAGLMAGGGTSLCRESPGMRACREKAARAAWASGLG